MTTADQAAAATKFLDKDFKRAYDSLKDGEKRYSVHFRIQAA
jgi:hypothetical protein